jgi:hypothetical protein
MQLTVLLMSEPCPADKQRERAATVPAPRASMPPVLVARGVAAERATAALVRLCGGWLRRRATLRIGLIAAIILGASSVAQGLASRVKMGELQSPAQVATALHSEPGSPGGDARPASHSPHGWHKRFHKFPKRIAANDPSDDGTSRDPDDEDDDASDDLNCDDESDGTIVAWVPPAVLYLIAAETARAPSTIKPHSPLFLTLQRFRC